MFESQMPCICYPFVALRQTLLNNPPNPLTPFKCALHLHMSIVHSACVNVTPTARTLPLRAVVGTLRLKSNGESKIAESKAALCCGFAIALRALFLGILSCRAKRNITNEKHFYPSYLFSRKATTKPSKNHKNIGSTNAHSGWINPLIAKRESAKKTPQAMSDIRMDANTNQLNSP